MKIHAFHDASAALTVYLTIAFAALAMVMTGNIGQTLLLTSGALAFVAIMASVATDLMSKRIPNSLSLMLLAAAPVWWAGLALGGDAGNASDGIARTLMSNIDEIYGTGALLPGFNASFPLSIPIDIAGMIVVFIPLLLSFRLGLGFGGGDVKLITAGALFFGWPLGFDFLAVSFIFGGIFSVFIILGRMFCRVAVKFGAKGDRVRRLAELREFPYAPAIAISGILCLATKLEGLF
jgi:Flp pilus assembly protein protease CpaA